MQGTSRLLPLADRVKSDWKPQSRSKRIKDLILLPLKIVVQGWGLGTTLQILSAAFSNCPGKRRGDGKSEGTGALKRQRFVSAAEPGRAAPSPWRWAPPDARVWKEKVGSICCLSSALKKKQNHPQTYAGRRGKEKELRKKKNKNKRTNKQKNRAKTKAFGPLIKTTLINASILRSALF